jgi:ABC-type nickel/cobalt efflux system permease component RcnA
MKTLVGFFLIAITVLSFGLIFSKLEKAYAHAIDTSNLYIYYSKELDDAQIAPNKLSAYLYMNFYQAGALVQNATGSDALLDMEELVNSQYDEIYRAHIKENLSITNNGELCDLSFVNLEQNLGDYPLDLGKRIVMNFNCKEDISQLKISNKLFFEDFYYETNYVDFYKGQNIIEQIEANRTYPEYTLNLDADGNIKAERPEDFVSTNGNVSPLDSSYMDQNFDPSKDSGEADSNLTFNNYLLKFKAFYENLRKIGNIGEMNPLYLMGILFLLGFLHTLEAGHSKVVLSSAMVHKNMSIKGGIMYAIVFTVTHIGDIVILGLALLIVNSYKDIYNSFSQLEKFAGYALLFVGAYLFLKSASDYIQIKFLKKEVSHTHTHGGHSHSHEHSHEHAIGESEHSHSHDFDPHKSFKDQLIVGFLSGLAPCVFGWSILMVIVSAKKLWLLVPAILSFSLGIFSALVLVVLVIGKFKKSLFNKVNWITEISPMISALILIVYAIYII